MLDQSYMMATSGRLWKWQRLGLLSSWKYLLMKVMVGYSNDMWHWIWVWCNITLSVVGATSQHPRPCHSAQLLMWEWGQPLLQVGHLASYVPNSAWTTPRPIATYQVHPSQLSFNGIDFPVKVTCTDRFEGQNDTVAMNLFGWNKYLYPMHISWQKGRPHNIDLVLLTDPNNTENKHYIWIKELAHMCYKNDSNGHCLKSISTTAAILVTNPSHPCARGRAEHLKFTDHHRKILVPFIIYVDFEVLNVKTDISPDRTTKQLTKHVPYGFWYIWWFTVMVLSKSQSSTMGLMLWKCLKDSRKARSYPCVWQTGWYDDDRWRHNSLQRCKSCHICKPGKVRDHCYITGNYCGAANSVFIQTRRRYQWSFTICTAVMGIYWCLPKGKKSSGRKDHIHPK